MISSLNHFSSPVNVFSFSSLPQSSAQVKQTISSLMDQQNQKWENYYNTIIKKITHTIDPVNYEKNISAPPVDDPDILFGVIPKKGFNVDAFQTSFMRSLVLSLSKIKIPENYNNVLSRLTRTHTSAEINTAIDKVFPEMKLL